MFSLYVMVTVLEKEFAPFQQLKGITDLQTVMNVCNETNILRKELGISYNSLNSVQMDAEAKNKIFLRYWIKPNLLNTNWIFLLNR